MYLFFMFGSALMEMIRLGYLVLLDVNVASLHCKEGANVGKLFRIFRGLRLKIYSPSIPFPDKDQVFVHGVGIRFVLFDRIAANRRVSFDQHMMDGN